MATIKLGNRPKTIKHTVKFPMLDGTEGQIACEFKYRTRREFGEFIERMTADIKPVEGTAAIHAAQVEQSAKYLAEVLEGWDLDTKMNQESLAQLVDELPAASNAILDAYRGAIIEGRLGN